MTPLHLARATETVTDNSGIGALLNSANATVRELLASCPPGDPMQTGLRRVQQTMERLTVLTGQLDSGNGHRARRATPLDLNSVLREMVAPLQRLLGPFITLDTALHQPSLWAAGDRSQFEQVALGLVINAREALPLGGRVRLATHRLVLDTATQYRIGSLPAGTWAVLEVSDNGSGVGDRSAGTHLGGAVRALPFDSSLSLSTVSTVVTEAGGHVILDMPDGGGTVLAACFPAVAPPRVRQPATGTANAVLILDDDEWSRMSAARTLRHAGFGVLEAGDTDDALELLDDVAGSCVRLIVVDLKHLLEGAHPLGERIRRERPEIEILVTAGHRGSAGGAEAPVLTKPFAPDDLLRVIRERFLALA